jgi:phenylalanyl-tRNA synthetase beta chain
VVTNQRHGQAFGLFEAGSVFPAGPAVPYHEIFEPLPPEVRMIGAVLVGGDGPALFRRAKGALEMLARSCHLTDLRFAETGEGPAWADRSARLAVTSHGARAGTLGLLTKRCKRLAGIADLQVACFELDLRTLATYQSRQNRYEPVSELPEADFDLSVVIADPVRWREISSAVLDTSEAVDRVEFIDEFRGARLPEGHRSVTLRVTLRPRETTFTADAIAAVRDEVIAVLTRTFDARLRG